MVCFFLGFPQLPAKTYKIHKELNPFEQAELIRLLNLDFRNLAHVQVQGVLGYDQQY